jgi:putative Ca2+/H+ antiporter (TMEM165/GDT1 family)
MEPKTFLAVFGTVFLAELGDKTQLATLLFASKPEASRWSVFLAAAAALTAAAALAVLAGGFVAQHVSAKALSTVAGLGFIAIGAWTLWRA